MHRLAAIAATGLLATSPTHANPPELLTTGFWCLGGNGRVSLNCPFPVAGRPDLAIDMIRLAYCDPEGRTGNASV